MSGYYALTALSLALAGLSLYWDRKINRRLRKANGGLRKANEGLRKANEGLLAAKEMLASGVQTAHELARLDADLITALVKHKVGDPQALSNKELAAEVLRRGPFMLRSVRDEHRQKYAAATEMLETAAARLQAQMFSQRLDRGLEAQVEQWAAEQAGGDK